MASSSLPTSAAATIPCHAQDLFVASSSLPTSAAATIPCHAQDLFDGVIAISDLCRSDDPMTTSSGDGPQFGGGGSSSPCSAGRGEQNAPSPRGARGNDGISTDIRCGER